MSILNYNKLYHKYFEELTKIPHGSGNEKHISDFLVEFAKHHELEVHQDHVNNVVIYKKATPGYEDHEPVILQAHIDMVNEKDRNSNHDFSKDPLELKIENGYLMANGTTLGADDGAGVAYIMSILTDPNAQHPHLTALYTVNEEETMIGAFELDPNLLKGKKLINIDAEDEHASNTASAGGMDIFVNADLEFNDSVLPGYKIEISGLRGGHSGGEIHNERANANKLMGRILHYLSKDHNILLENIKGGSKVNAIPRHAVASFVSADDVQDTFEKVSKEIKKEYEYTDKDIEITLSKIEIKKVLSREATDNIINLIYLMPTGFRHKSFVLDGLTTASENIGIIFIKDNVFELEISVRGALDSYVQDLAEELHCLAKLLNFEPRNDNWYPAWDYMPHSPLRDTMKRVYKKTHPNQELQLFAVHGGLECGIFKGKIPSLDIVTMGPNIYDVHSPSEKLDLESFDRTYKFLCDFLKEL